MISITAAKSPPFSASTACQSSSWIKNRNVFRSPHATGGSVAHDAVAEAEGGDLGASATFHAHLRPKPTGSRSGRRRWHLYRISDANIRQFPKRHHQRERRPALVYRDHRQPDRHHHHKWGDDRISAPSRWASSGHSLRPRRQSLV